MTPATPSMRILAARAAARLVAPSDPSHAAELLESAVLLLPEIAPRQLRRDDQQYALGLLADMASDAAALTLAAATGSSGERARRALRLLEAGRAVLLSQTLDTRSDLTDLHQQHPELAAEFEGLRDQLDDLAEAAADGILAETPTSQPEVRRKMAEQLASSADRIRNLDGFASFGLPPAIEELLSQAADGPLVTFNISSYRSDALVINNSDISSIELPALTHPAVSLRARAFQQAPQRIISPTASPASREAAQDTFSETLEWLWDTAAEPVLKALEYYSEPSSDGDWPTVWWIPCGLLNLLPIHAAGYHRNPNDRQRRTVMDRVISSYTPTVRALRYSRDHEATDISPERVMIVAMPTTPGMTSPLYHVLDEVARLRIQFPSATVLTAHSARTDAQAELPEDLPTKANVIATLAKSHIAHFACHGATDPDNPSNSLLLLHDHATDPLTVGSLAAVKLDYARLAYLSACRTAITALIDEAIHLFSSFQLVGFPHVIGTLWEIDDNLAVEIAERFYSNLRTMEGTIDTGRSAFALHQTIRIIRDNNPGNPFLWAAYVHSGS